MAEIVKVKIGFRGGGGPSGLSAYQIAVAHGFDGSEADWLSSLKGTDGASVTVRTFTNQADWAAYVPGPNEWKVLIGA